MSFLFPSCIALPCPHKTHWNTPTHALPWGKERVGGVAGAGGHCGSPSYLPTCYEPPWLFRRVWSLASHRGQHFTHLRFPSPCQGMWGRGCLCPLHTDLDVGTAWM